MPKQCNRIFLRTLKMHFHLTKEAHTQIYLLQIRIKVPLKELKWNLPFTPKYRIFNEITNKILREKKNNNNNSNNKKIRLKLKVKSWQLFV